MSFQHDSQEHSRDKLSTSGKILLVLFLLTLSIWIFPGEGGIFKSLVQEKEHLTITGLVKAAPYETPIPNAMVCSDRELVLTDDKGFFRLLSARDAVLRIEAKGYEKAKSRITDRAPLVFLLTPAQLQMDATTLKTNS